MLEVDAHLVDALVATAVRRSFGLVGVGGEFKMLSCDPDKSEVPCADHPFLYWR